MRVTIMSRLLGLYETKLYRKRRKDAGKKRQMYAGKPCEHKKSYYKRRTGDKNSFWMWVWYRKPMSKDGLKNWQTRMRPRVYKEVTDWNSIKPFRVPFDMINTKCKMEQFIANIGWTNRDGSPGKFVVMGGSHAKNKGHFKPVHVCTIMVKQTTEGNIGDMVVNKRLFRYWWYIKDE
jgi:hypothetical protein